MLTKSLPSELEQSSTSMIIALLYSLTVCVLPEGVNSLLYYHCEVDSSQFHCFT